jgi:hypothetical protein
MSLMIRIEEIPTVGKIELHAFHDDKADFVNFSPDYDGSFETDWETKNDALDVIVSTHFHIGKIAAQTKLIEDELPTILPLLDPLEVYVKKAKSSLTVTVKLFGISAVRKAIHSGDVEQLDGKLFTLVENITANFDALETKGYKDADFTILKNKKQKIFDLNTTQEAWKYDKQQAVEQNIGLFNEVLAIIKDVQMTGKALYKRSNPAKALEYTMADILRKIRQDGGGTPPPPTP